MAKILLYILALKATHVSQIALKMTDRARPQVLIASGSPFIYTHTTAQLGVLGAFPEAPV